MPRKPASPTLFDERPQGSNRPEFGVAELARLLKKSIENDFGDVRVRGEVTQPKLHSSGHLYLTLKDEDAVLAAVCWRATVPRLQVKPEEGMEVVATGRLTTYPGRSQYQLIIENMALAGIGALLKMLEERKKKLAAEGLFDAARKKPLPFLPRVIGVITSPTGAVIRDILHRIAGRFPLRVLLWPVAVQGEGAAQQVARAIAGFNALLPDGALPRPDLLIVARGGGSFEDMLPFYEEVVVRAAAASRIPLISAIGHETDTCLMDHAADMRAPTPTAAAEMAVPVRLTLLARLEEMETRLRTLSQRMLATQRLYLDKTAARLTHPRFMLENLAQRLDDGIARFDRAAQRFLEGRRGHVQKLAAHLGITPLQQQIGHHAQRLATLAERLESAPTKFFEKRAQRVTHLAALLESFSYHSVLKRGFALVRDAKGHTITSAAAITAGAPLTLSFADGEKVVRA